MASLNESSGRSRWRGNDVGGVCGNAIRNPDKWTLGQQCEHANQTWLVSLKSLLTTIWKCNFSSPILRPVDIGPKTILDLFMGGDDKYSLWKNATISGQQSKFVSTAAESLYASGLGETLKIQCLSLFLLYLWRGYS